MFLKLITILPQGFSENLISILYFLAFPFIGRERSTIYFHAREVLNLPKGESRMFVKKVLCSQVRIYWDTLRFVYNPSTITIDGLDEFRKVFDEIKAHNQGHVIITAHLGAWELAGHFCAQATGKMFYVLAKPSKSKWLDPFLNRLRVRLGMKVLWIDSKSLYRDMLKAIDYGDGVGFVMDQRPAIKNGGDLVRFLGVENTPIVTGPAVLTTKKNVPVVGCYCMRVGPGKYRVVANSIFKSKHGETLSQNVSSKLVLDMESMIHNYPEQWAWNYRRWKHHALELKRDHV